MGVYMNLKGKTAISVESEHMIHSVWAFVQFSAETGVFVLVGIIMSTQMEQFITWEDAMKNVALYIFLHVTRFLGICLLTPIMNLMDYKLDFAQIVFASYAGMRGAVAMCLALLLTENEKVPKSVSLLILFHVCGIVILTLFINGLTAAALLKALGLQNEKKISQKLMAEFLKKVEDKKMEFVEDFKHHDQFLEGVNWDGVKEDCKLDQVTKKYTKKFRIEGEEMTPGAKKYATSTNPLDDSLIKVDDVLVEIRQ